MAEVAESKEDRLDLDGSIVNEQLEGLGTIELVEPESSTDLKVGMQVRFLDINDESGQRCYGSITSILSDTQIGLMWDRMARSAEK